MPITSVCPIIRAVLKELTDIPVYFLPDPSTVSYFTYELGVMSDFQVDKVMNMKTSHYQGHSLFIISSAFSLFSLYSVFLHIILRLLRADLLATFDLTICLNSYWLVICFNIFLNPILFKVLQLWTKFLPSWIMTASACDSANFCAKEFEAFV